MNARHYVTAALAVLATCAPIDMALAQMDMLAPPAGSCQLELSGDTSIEWRGLYGRGYEVTSHEQNFEPVSLEVRHSGAACDYYIVATPMSPRGENVLTNAGEKLYWDLLQDTNGPTLVSRDFLGSLANQLGGRFGPVTAAQPITLFFTILPGQFVRGGNYSGRILLRLFTTGDEGPELVAEQPIALIATVASILEIRSDEFAGGQRELTLDLGNLSTAPQRSIDFDLRSNASIGVSFASLNRGLLAHQFNAPGVPYDVRMNGFEIPLDYPRSQPLDLMAPGGSQSATIEIIVPPATDMLAAGHYTDALTITFTGDP